MKIKNLLEKAYNELNSLDISNPAFEAGLLLANILKKDRMYLYINSDKIVDDKIVEKLISDIKLRKDNMPIQYIIGNQEFMGLNFKVNKNVLIPRADTEILVEQALEFSREKEKLKILDIGTGSGCIAVSLAYYLKKSSITALDISKEALDIAFENAVINNVSERINFVQSDIFSNLKKQKFDLIVSNPPYIDETDCENLSSDVKDFEPINALFGGKDGMLFYDMILKEVVNFLGKDSKLMFEIGYNQNYRIQKLIKNYNLKHDKTVKDLSSNDRVVIISL